MVLQLTVSIYIFKALKPAVRAHPLLRTLHWIFCFNSTADICLGCWAPHWSLHLPANRFQNRNRHPHASTITLCHTYFADTQTPSINIINTGRVWAVLTPMCAGENRVQ